jgi:hypothetical protein
MQRYKHFICYTLHMGAESHEKTPYTLNDPALDHQLQQDPSLLARAWQELKDENPQIASNLRTIANIVSHDNPIRKQGILEGMAYQILKNKRHLEAEELEKILDDHGDSI